MNRSANKQEIAQSPLLHDKKSFYAYLYGLFVSQKDRLRIFSVLVLVNFILMGLGFITRVKIANVLGKADFGLFVYGVTLGTFGGVIIRYGMDKTLVRDLIHHRAQFNELVAGIEEIRIQNLLTCHKLY